MSVENRDLINTFYTAFNLKDYSAMQKLYHDEAQFIDPIFGKLNAKEVRNMWEMLIKRAPDLKVSVNNIHVDENNGTADWAANYTFSGTGRWVENKIHATFTFKDGLILTHIDYFNFYKWAKQSLGLVGFLIGWTSFLKQKTAEQARNSLFKFINKRQT